MNDDTLPSATSDPVTVPVTHRPARAAGVRLPTPPLSMPPIGSLKDGDLATPMGLRDFMMDLGSLLQLPPRSSAAARVTPPRIGGTRRGTRMRVGLPLLAFVTLSIWAFSYAPRSTRVDVPDALLGEWETANPKYAGRRIAFVTGQLILALGARQPAQVFTIRTLTSKSLRDTTWYDLEYQDGDALTSLRFRFVQDPAPRILLANPPDVLWSRVALPVQTHKPGD